MKIDKSFQCFWRIHFQIDAIALGTKRIGHGYALAKHPKLLNILKEKDIAVEVNPISNQIVKLVDDFRNHPAATLSAQNVPIVVSSDNPCLWETSPLTHDFYMALLGIASAVSDLLAMNSLKYSSLNDAEKVGAFAKWQMKWESGMHLLKNFFFWWEKKHNNNREAWTKHAIDFHCERKMAFLQFDRNLCFSI